MNYVISLIVVVGILIAVHVERQRHSMQPVAIANTETIRLEQRQSLQPEQLQQEYAEHIEEAKQDEWDSQTLKVYKCKIPKGGVIYSEAPCPLNTVGSRIAIAPNVIDSTDLRRQIANSKNQASVTSTVTTLTSADNEDYMSPYKRDTRIRELNMSINDEVATYEKRADARNELTYLKDRNPKNLSYELEQQRRNWKVELTDLDRQKRGNALLALATVYTNYR